MPGGGSSKNDNSKIIKIACKSSDTIDWHIIKPLQGEYKTLTVEELNKSCRVIIKRGIRFPSFVSKIEDDVWAIDTHQRLKAFEELERRGYTIPPVPIDWIEAKDKEEAKQLLLECDSRYGKAQQEGFDDFISDLDTDFLDDLEIPDIDIDIDDEENTPKKINLSPYNKVHVLLSFPPDKFPEIQKHLETLKNTEGIEYEQSAN